MAHYASFINGNCQKECGLCDVHAHPKYCQLGLNNVMCKEPRGINEKMCGKKKSVKTPTITTRLKKIILRLHNAYRNGISKGKYAPHFPKSKKHLPKLKWSPELAKMAQRGAEQCTFDHDENMMTAKYGIVGQNLYASSKYSDKLWNKAIDGWFSERKDFVKQGCKIDSFKTCNKGIKKMIGHFTQVIWADTTEIGCGMVYAKHSKKKFSAHSRHHIKSFLYCNYGPGGNIYQKPIYVVK